MVKELSKHFYMDQESMVDSFHQGRSLEALTLGRIPLVKKKLSSDRRLKIQKIAVGSI